jgi:hypothetical protein
MPANPPHTSVGSGQSTETGGYVALDWDRLLSQLEIDGVLRRRVLAAPSSGEWPDLELAQSICRAIDARIAALAALDGA